jgi:hypothetical protein
MMARDVRRAAPKLARALPSWAPYSAIEGSS